MDHLTGLFLVSVLAIIATDAAAFYRLHQDPDRLTIPFVVLVIGITILPIAIRYIIAVS